LRLIRNGKEQSVHLKLGQLAEAQTRQ